MEKWYAHAFGLDYLEIYSHRNKEEALSAIDFIEEETAISRNDLILDLCCGPGRHAIELSARGYTVIGLDLSLDLLMEARRRAHEDSRRLPLVRAEMEHIPFTSSFNLVINLFNSFGYYMSEKRNENVLLNIYDSLVLNGVFLMDYFNKPWVLSHLEPVTERTLESGVKLIERRAFDHTQNRINKTTTVIKNNEKSERIESVRLYSPHELKSMIEQAGFSIEKTFGGFDKRPYDNDSSHLIIVASKRGK